MRYCAWKECNRSLGEQEEGVLIAGDVVHAQCEDGFRKELSDKIAKSQRRRLYLPTLNELEGFGDSFR